MLHKHGFLSRHFDGMKLGIACSVLVPVFAFFYPFALVVGILTRPQDRLFGQPAQEKLVKNICLLAFVLCLVIGGINFVEARMLYNSFQLPYSLTLPVLWFGEWALLGLLFFTHSEEQVKEEEEEGLEEENV
jgi:hypothetical protein